MSKKKRWIPGIVGFCLILGTTGCAGLADTGNTYALDQRIETFASSGSGRTADGFATDLAVVTDGTDGDGTLTAQSAGVFPLDGEMPYLRRMFLNAEILPARRRS